MSILLRVVAVLLGIIVVAVVLAFAGLQIQPRPFAPYPGATPDLPTSPVPAGLPAPVARFYAAAIGDQAPVITSAVLTGRGVMRINGLRFPVRYRFTHAAGQGYHHYMEPTIWGLPLFKVDEWYLDGHARMVLPMGTIENDPKTDLAANLALWGESIGFPSLYITDPRARWEAIDDTHARLVVPAPAGEESDSLVFAFDPDSGLVLSMEAMRWKSPDAPAKLSWRIDLADWQRVDGMLVPTYWALTWEDEKGAWFTATLEEFVYNVDVAEYIRKSGQ